MQANVRKPIYHVFNAVLDRHLTMDERTKLDRLLDAFGVSKR